MRALSYWASQHIWAARVLIVLSYILVSVIGILLACLLPAEGLSAARIFIFIAATTTIIATICYPSGEAGKKEKSWQVRKWCDFMLCTATLLFTIGNTARELDGARHISVYAASRHEKAVSKDKKSIMQSVGHTNNFFQRLYTLHNWYPHQSTGIRILIVFAVVLLGLGITGVWAAVCCGIACGGAEALAICLFIAGFAGIVFGCVRLIQKSLHTGRWR